MLNCSAKYIHIYETQLQTRRRNLRNTLFISHCYNCFCRCLRILRLAKHARFLEDFAQIRTAEVDRARGNWQRRALNAAFTGLRKTAARMFQVQSKSRNNDQETRTNLIHEARGRKCVPVAQPEKGNRCAITTRGYP